MSEAATPKMPNTDTDDPNDHGTGEWCQRCTGAGCPNAPLSLDLTLTVTVRRSLGDARSTGDILWKLQDLIAEITEFDVDGSDYEIEHVDYVVSTTP